MIAVEIDGVRVEAETEKEAKQLVAKAARAAKKVAEVQKVRRALARERAMANGYRLLHRKASGDAFPGGWTLYAPHHKWAHNIAKPLPVEYSRGGKHSLETEYGAAELDHYGYRLVGAVCNGAGFCMAVVLEDCDRPGTATTYAIGAEEGEICLEDCPGVLASDFRQGDETAKLA